MNNSNEKVNTINSTFIYHGKVMLESESDFAYKIGDQLDLVTEDGFTTSFTVSHTAMAQDCGDVYLMEESNDPQLPALLLASKFINELPAKEQGAFFYHLMQSAVIADKARGEESPTRHPFEDVMEEVASSNGYLDIGKQAMKIIGASV